ncbi:MAG: hypothetical protein ABSD31_15680 [Candidatus Binataceae bacterium]
MNAAQGGVKPRVGRWYDRSLDASATGAPQSIASGVSAMAKQKKFSDPMDQEIYDTHRRYLQVMEEQRLSTINGESKTFYLTVLKSLTSKLEVPGKPLSEVIREMMAEAAPMIFQVMQG